MQDNGYGRRVFLGVAGLLLVALGVRWLLDSRPGMVSGRTPFTQVSSRRAPDAGGSGPGLNRGELIVQVAGLVRRPGIYRLPQGARAYQALRAAGGATGKGDPNALQLASRLNDGTRLVVPARGPVAGSQGGLSGTDTSDPAQAGPLSLSSATAAQLEALDGVGPALARRIVEWRQSHGGFSSVADLDRVPGIGPAKFAAIKSAVVP